MKPGFTKIDGWVLTALALLPFAWYATPIFTDASYYVGDLMAQYNPWWTFGHESLRDGYIPLWNPYVFGGMPYHVNPENSLFYPLKLPLLWLSFFKAAALLRALNSIVASIGMYLLLRSYMVQQLPRVLGALMFTYGSFMSYNFLHIPYLNTAAWFPLQLLLLNRLIQRPGALTSILLALVTASSFLGGSPGIFLVCQMTLASFLLFHLSRMGADAQWAQVGRSFTWLGFAVLLVIGLALVLLAPAWQFIQLSPRAGGLVNPPTFRDFVLTRQGLLAFLFPYAHFHYGAPYPPLYPIPFLNVPYVGAGAVLLALFNLGSRRHLHLILAALVAITLGVLAAMGTRTALFPWLVDHFAVFSWFRWPHDYLLMAYLVLPILAATGLDSLMRGSAARRWWLASLASFYLLVGLIWLRQPVAAIALLTSAGAAAVGWLANRFKATPRTGAWAGGFLAFLFVVDLWAFGSNHRLYLDREALAAMYEDDALRYLQQHAGFDRVAIAAPNPGAYFRDQDRIFNQNARLIEALPARNLRLLDLDSWLRQRGPTERSENLWARRTTYHNTDELFRDYPVNAAMIFRYQEVSGYDPFTIDRVKTMYRTLPQRRSWDLMGTRYVVTPNRVVGPRLTPVFSGHRLNIYENTGRFPRTFVPSNVEFGLDPDQVLDRLDAPDFDPTRVTLFETALPRDQRHGGSGTARVVEYQPDRVTVEAELQRPGFLVLHDVYHPGWKAHTGGTELEILRANFVFRAVHLPAGRHRVEFLYAPDLFSISALISITFWMLCLGYVARATLGASKYGAR